MLFLLVHNKDLGDALYIKDIFLNHNKVKKEPEILLTKHMSKSNGTEIDYATSIVMESK